ncbi:1-phosphofructokinase family hexose kinase [Hydrogenophaga sp.]|uniref:1-phosphofructokinase family hexose kinase n=1 Tax=Hydrogenophaga sp. TaxID=1904254 RepID=UPI00271D7F7F|nr:1-phosphofructokinase family hexose kinase [Hydrogenophaga sp.]MDO8904050.1 1-phosphofructokinase family hexose kinase [Hydrogenophaga sp.]
MNPASTPPTLSVLCLTMNPAVDLATETQRVLPTHKLRCSDTLHDAGGGGINVARVLARMGGAPALLSLAGGPTGDWLRTRLVQEGLAATLLPIENDTRISFTVHENATGAEFRFVMPGPTLSTQEWQACLDHLQALDPFPDVLVASGSLPPGVPDHFYARLARLCRARGARLVLDTAGAPLAAALDEGVYLVKPNLRELRELMGQPLEDPAAWQAAAASLVNDGRAQVVALTLGHLGAVLATTQGLWVAAPLSIEVASAVGAGDSFVGGLVWAVQHHRPLTEAFAWGVAAGSAALLTTGTGLCNPQDVQRLQPTVSLSHVPTSGAQQALGQATEVRQAPDPG